MSVALRTVAGSFDELLRRLELDPTRAALASQRYGSVKGLIETALRGKVVTQVGSFRRKTKIRPRDPDHTLDVDAVVSFGDAHRFATDGTGLSPGAALEIVRRALASATTYRLMSPESDMPTVVLEYADDFKIELIPCFVDKTGKYPRPSGPPCFLVGLSSGEWVGADYDYDSNVITGLNQSPAVRGALVPSIKMIKAFARNLNLGLKSFHLEILAANIVPAAVADWETRGLRWGYQHVLAYFLSYVAPQLTGPAALPGSYSTPVDSGLPGYELIARGEILESLGERARVLCKLDDRSEALEGWCEFFGEPFPS